MGKAGLERKRTCGGGLGITHAFTFRSSCKEFVDAMFTSSLNDEVGRVLFGSNYSRIVLGEKKRLLWKPG